MSSPRPLRASTRATTVASLAFSRQSVAAKKEARCAARSQPKGKAPSSTRQNRNRSKAPAQGRKTSKVRTNPVEVLLVFHVQMHGKKKHVLQKFLFHSGAKLTMTGPDGFEQHPTIDEDDSDLDEHSDAATSKSEPKTWDFELSPELDEAYNFDITDAILNRLSAGQPLLPEYHIREGQFKAVKNGKTAAVVLPDTGSECMGMDWNRVLDRLQSELS